MRYLIIVLSLFLITCGGGGPTNPNQDTNENTAVTFGGNGPDLAVSLQETSDGGFILAGNTRSFGAGDYDVYLVKTDVSGNHIWSQTFGGSALDEAHSVQETLDGGFILAGISNSFGAGDYDGYLVKTDASGNEIWSQTFGGNNEDNINSVGETSDGSLILAGGTRSFGVAPGYSNMYLVKTDASGNEIWSQTFGGSDDDHIESFEETSDGGFILVGRTYSYGAGSGDMYLVKTDASGNEIWSQTFGGGDLERAYSVQETSDGGFILIGFTRSFGAGDDDVYLVKTDVSGNEIWSQTFGGSDDDRAYSVQETSDGSFIFAGHTRSYGAGSGDMYLVKIDVSGNEIWSQTFGGSAFDRAFSVQETSDGGFILAGETFSYGAGSGDMYLVKTDSQGNRIF